ncbi:MAG: PKD domain-containing protein [Candidatus Bipolaricaulaceae bacterium]
MSRFALLTVVFTLIPVGLSGQVALVQPTADHFPPQSVAELLVQVRKLEGLLADWRLGSGRAAVELDWGERELARYAGGRLAGLGYPAQLARDGERWWVLARVEAAGDTLWVPIVPGVAAGDRGAAYAPGVFLGHVAWGEGGLFASAYLTPEEILPLPDNRPPQAVARVVPSRPEVGEEARFFGSASSDPDGVVVQYLWAFGDGRTAVGMNTRHTFDRTGFYQVALTVVDDAGETAVDRISVRITSAADDGGCGCGG